MILMADSYVPKPASAALTKRSSRAVCFHESMAIMGLTSRAIDKLPTWAKLILGILAVLGSVYYIANYGFFTFLLRMIFSPVP